MNNNAQQEQNCARIIMSACQRAHLYPTKIQKALTVGRHCFNQTQKILLKKEHNYAIQTAAPECRQPDLSLHDAFNWLPIIRVAFRSPVMNVVNINKKVETTMPAYRNKVGINTTRAAHAYT